VGVDKAGRGHFGLSLGGPRRSGELLVLETKATEGDPTADNPQLSKPRGYPLLQTGMPNSLIWRIFFAEI
jgi:hypothetical protein